ncbi:hypothetical protein SOCE26_098950 [Sorangium cellulosum]|uniref:Uncharacterized protein n=1 Tax=Sorangium cellulosum TaxID=56 RepID=A0A2L0FA19_SORCE|nr:hypothetical protein [Sorangium cellulosum]AUX48361.1 hypothetical protein SOCE26_098950 [Sorangium cellulosum]
MSSSAAERHGVAPGERHGVAPGERHGVAPGVELRLALLAGARETRETPQEALPAIDVSAIRGAKVALRRGVEADGLSLRAVCATAPSRQWATGVEELVLDRASGITRGTLGMSIDRWEAGPIRATAQRFEQSFEAAGRAGAHAVAIRGRHVLGFAGSEHDVVLCSVVCVEPAQEAGARCGPLLDAAALEGTLVGPPEPDLLVRTILYAAEHPLPATAAFGLLAAAGITVLLARRPYPRP